MLETLLPLAQKTLASNQFLSGGLVLGGLGAAAMYAKAIPMYAADMVKRKVISSVEIDESEPIYYWFKHWLSQHPYAQKTRSFTATIATDRSNMAPMNSSDGREKPSVLFVPSPGLHWFRHKGHFYWLLIDREKSESSGGKIAYHERITLSTLARTPKLLHALVDEAYETFLTHGSKHVRVYTHHHGSWNLMDVKTKRDPKALVLDGDLWQDLEADMKDFLASQSWYLDKCIPWHRGYLLFGPPGNGKSSLVMTAASVLGGDIYCINLASYDMDDANLMQLLSRVPRGAIVLIEEIDTAGFKRRDEEEEEEGEEDKKKDDEDDGSRGGVSFGGLLNALDGVGAQEGRIVFMTTNHPEKLDPALVRPGRVDVQVEIKNASKAQAGRLFRKFFPDCTDEQASRMEDAVPQREFGMAVLQEHFMSHRNDAEDAIATAPAMVWTGL